MNDQLNVSRRRREGARRPYRFYQQTPITIMPIMRPRRPLSRNGVDVYQVTYVRATSVLQEYRRDVRVSKEATACHLIVLDVCVVKATLRELRLRAFLRGRYRRSAASNNLSATQYENNCRGLEGKVRCRTVGLGVFLLREWTCLQRGFCLDYRGGACRRSGQEAWRALRHACQAQAKAS